VIRIKCEFCNSATVLKKVKKQHWHKGRLYIVENVDAEVCPECGERYFHATMLDKIDQIIANDHPVKEILSVEVLTA
jgi:YgiT-type zinc finger domain-containing protein